MTIQLHNIVINHCRTYYIHIYVVYLYKNVNLYYTAITNRGMRKNVVFIYIMILCTYLRSNAHKFNFPVRIGKRYIRTIVR